MKSIENIGKIVPDRENMNIRNMNLNEIVRNDQSQRISCHVTCHVVRLRDPRWKILRFSQRKSTRKWISNRVRIRIFFFVWTFMNLEISVYEKSSSTTKRHWHVTHDTWGRQRSSAKVSVYTRVTKSKVFFICVGFEIWSHYSQKNQQEWDHIANVITYAKR